MAAINNSYHLLNFLLDSAKVDINLVAMIKKKAAKFLNGKTQDTKCCYSIPKLSTDLTDAFKSILLWLEGYKKQ